MGNLNDYITNKRHEALIKKTEFEDSSHTKTFEELVDYTLEMYTQWMDYGSYEFKYIWNILNDCQASIDNFTDKIRDFLATDLMSQILVKAEEYGISVNKKFNINEKLTSKYITSVVGEVSNLAKIAKLDIEYENKLDELVYGPLT